MNRLLNLSKIWKSINPASDSFSTHTKQAQVLFPSSKYLYVILRPCNKIFPDDLFHRGENMEFENYQMLALCSDQSGYILSTDLIFMFKTGDLYEFPDDKCSKLRELLAGKKCHVFTNLALLLKTKAT